MGRQGLSFARELYRASNVFVFPLVLCMQLNQQPIRKSTGSQGLRFARELCHSSSGFLFVCFSAFRNHWKERGLVQQSNSVITLTFGARSGFLASYEVIMDYGRDRGQSHDLSRRPARE